jgi:hypothetical protein
MAQLPVSLDPCENLEADVNDKIHQLEQEGTILRSKVEDLRKELTDFADVPSTSNAMDTAIAGMTADNVNAGTTAIATIRNFSGTCLNEVYAQAKKYSTELDSWLTDTIDDITSLIGIPEVDMLTPLRALTTALGGSAITNLISELDKKLGCLADQGSELGECLDLIDNFNARIDDVLTYLGLGADATFDLDDFISNFNINMDSTALSNLKQFDVSMDTLTADIRTNITNLIPWNLVPPQLY